MRWCNICGEPMSEWEEMFMYPGHSGPCPKPPLQIFLSKIAHDKWKVCAEKLAEAIRLQLKLGDNCGKEYINGELTSYTCHLHEALKHFDGVEK